jgi:hypothetical protein
LQRREIELRRDDKVWAGRFSIPDVRDALARAKDPSLPGELLSLDQVQDSRPDLMVNIAADEHRSIPAVKWIGKAKLPQAFLDVYGFGDGQRVETWKIVPWALADRVWLVVRPAHPLPLDGPQPALTINGAAVALAPRVDHRFKRVADWNCPLFHADITSAVRWGAEDNGLALSIPGQDDPPLAFITTAAELRR